MDDLVDFVLRNAVVKTHRCTRAIEGADYICLPRTIDDYNLLYNVGGPIQWRLDGEWVNAGSGDLLIVPRNVRNEGRSLTKRMRLYSIHLEVLLPGGQDAVALLRLPKMRRVKKGCRLDRYYRGAMEEFDRPRMQHTFQMLPGWVRLIALELIRHDADAGLIEPAPIDPVVTEMLNVLASRMAEPITLSILSRLSGYSAQHLNRVFNQVLGVTPLQYLGKLRMQTAATLLIENNLTVKAVAERVGIEDPYYFSRLFKQQFGLSPVQYRESPGENE